MSSSEDESDDDVMMDNSDDEVSADKKKRIILPSRLSARKKSRSIDETEEHTGLSPRMHRMDIIKVQPPPDAGVFFLEDDGVETFSADGGDPRMAAVREVYSELDHRVERAALSAGMTSADPKVASVKKQLALRAAGLEAGLAEKFGGPSNRPYREAVSRVVTWIQCASDAELKELLEGRGNSLYLEDRQQYRHQLAPLMRNGYGTLATQPMQFSGV